MFKRYHITLGAKTTAGGVVTSASTTCSVNGAVLAVEGDRIDCPACRRQGVIKCVEPRLSDRYNGKEAALDGDQCICGCNPPPKLIANQAFKCQVISTHDSFVDANKAVEAASRTSGSTEHQMPLRLLDMITEKPYRNRPYRLELTGRVIEGVTDADGLTRPLSSAERAALVAWHISDAPPAA